MKRLVFKKVSKSFEDVKVLSEFSLELEEGKAYAIMAPSGAGKTTLARLAMGLEKADFGEVTNDFDCISAVFQEDRLQECFSALANLTLVSSKKNFARAEDLLARLELGDSSTKKVSELSGGMKRRVAIARALYHDYDLLILDEPFKGLDQELKSKVIEVIKAETVGKTVLLITHEKAEAEAFGAKVIEL